MNNYKHKIPSYFANKKLRKLLSGVLISMFLLPGLVHAVPLNWTLQNAVFDDGTSASGSFFFDADTSTYSNFNIVVQTGLLTAFTYDNSNSFILGSVSTTVQFLDFTNSRYIRFIFVAPLTNAGGTHALQLHSPPTNGSLECDNCTITRLFISGSVTASTIPEPTTLALLGLGLFGLGFNKRKKT